MNISNELCLIKDRVESTEGYVRVLDALLVAELAAQWLHENDQFSAEDLRAGCEALAGHLEITREIAKRTGL